MFGKILITLVLAVGCQSGSRLYPGSKNLLPNIQTINSSLPAAKLFEDGQIGQWFYLPISSTPLPSTSKKLRSFTSSISKAMGKEPPNQAAKSVDFQISYQQYLRQYKPNKRPRRLLQNEESVRFRQTVFRQAVKLINEHNRNLTRSYSMGLNEFTDFTDEELQKLYSGFKPQRMTPILEQSPTKRRGLSIEPSTQPVLSDVPKPYTEPNKWYIDFRDYTKMSVYNLGECGACSFFSTIDALHITTKIWGYDLEPFSFQAAISCFARSPQNLCKLGTDFIYIYDYVRKYGIGLADAYPYTDQMSPYDAKRCNYLKLKQPSYRKKLLFIKQIYSIEENDCREIINQLISRAITVGVIANPNFAKYKSGTYDYYPQTKEETYLHAVVLVGYYPDKGYLIKNAWGEKWGMEGYAYVTKESGVCKWAVYAKDFYLENS